MAKLQGQQLTYARPVCDAIMASTPYDGNVVVLSIERRGAPRISTSHACANESSHD